MLRTSARLLRTEPEVLALSFARMADALGNGLLIVLLPLYIAQQPPEWLKLPLSAQVGIVVSVYGFLFAFTQPLAGWASDRMGRRKPFIVGGLLVMLGSTLGFIFVHSYLGVLLLRSLQGLGVAAAIPAVLAFIANATEKATRGNAMGVYSTFRQAGFATGPLLGGLLHVYFGFNAAFVVGAVFLAIAVLLVEFTVEEGVEGSSPPGGRRFLLEDEEDGVVLEGPVLEEGDREGVEKEESDWPTPTNYALMASTVVMASSLSMISALENEFNERLTQTALGFGVAFSALTVARLFTQIPVGRLSDRIGRKKLIIFGLLALCPLTVLFGYVTTTLQLINLRLAQGVATACIAAPAFALAGDLARKGGEGREMSYVTMGFGLGMGVGPLLAGGLAGFLGFRVPFYVVGALSVVAAWTVSRWARESIEAL